MRDKLKKNAPQKTKFLEKPIPTTNQISETSEVSKSFDSDDDSSSSEYEIQNLGGAQSDFRNAKSIPDAVNLPPKIRKSVQVPSLDHSKNPNFFKPRNSNVISFGQGHFSLYHTTEKGNCSLINENDAYEQEGDEIVVSKTPNSKRSPKHVDKLLSENREESKLDKNYGDESEHISTTTKAAKTIYNVITNFYLVKKFISILRNATIFRRPKWLNAIHFNMINDWTFYKEGWNDEYQEITELNSDIKTNDNLKGFFKNALLRKILKNEWIIKIFQILLKLNIVFHPTRLFKVIWDTIHMIIIISYLYIIPINLSFDINVLSYYYNSQPILIMFYKYFTMMFLLSDIFINMNTAFYKKGELIYVRKKIVMNYMKEQLILDILSLLYIFFKIFLDSDFFGLENFLAFFFLLRVKNLNRITTRIEEFILLDETFFNFITLIKLIFEVLVLSHFFACIWHYISYINPLEETTWISYYNLSHEIWWKKYIHSYYFVVVVMNTVGFGDIVPQNYTEKIYAIFFIYVACGMFAYTINSIGIIVQDINKGKKIFKRNLHLINGYMKQKNISFDLRVRIRKYFEYIWKEERIHNEEETLGIINKLSKALKDELLFQGNGTILKKIPLFFKNFTQDTLRKLVYEMKELNFTPGEVIFAPNEIDDNSLFIVRKGEVELYVETPKFLDPITIVRKVKENEVFGEFSFFSWKERECFARSASFTSLFIITQKDFLNIIQSNTEDYQIYCEIKDNINLYEEYKRLFIKCFSCKAKDHSSLNCPLLHLKLSKQRILQKFNFSQPQKRGKFLRARKKTEAALKNKKKNESAANKYLRKLVQDEDETYSDDDLISSDELLDEPEKRESQPIYSDITEEDSVSSYNKEGNVSARKQMQSSSSKFLESDLNSVNTGSFKKHLVRAHSKKSLKSPLYTGDNSSDISSIMTNQKNSNNKNDKRNFYRKHLTLASEYQRALSKESLTKYSVNSKKSNRSRSPLMKNPSKREFPKVNPKLKSVQESLFSKSQIKAQESMISIPRFLKNTTEDSFIKDLSVILKREKQKKSDLSFPSKDSKNKTSTTTLEKTAKLEETLFEKLMKTNVENDGPLNFDLLKSFDLYFPHNNVENVILNISNIKNIKERKKKKKLNKLTTKKNNEISNLILYNTNKKTLVKKMESETHLELDKDKLIKILKEQERRLTRNKTYTQRFLEFVKIKKRKQSNFAYTRKKSVFKKK